MKDGNTTKRNGAEDNAISVAEVETFVELEVVLDDGLGPKWLLWRRRRYLVTMMAFLGEMTKELLRTNLSVAVFSMTENHTATDENGSAVYVQDFNWDVKTRGFLLSVFYYGFVTTHILGGILAVKYGGTKLYGLGVATTSISTLLTPAVARIHFYLLISLRVLEGMCEGILRPCLELIYAKWIPMEERSSLVAMVMTGNPWGAVLGMTISSAISYQWGWPAVFYVTGAIGMAWFIVWLILVKENPMLDTKISHSERIYILQSLRKTQQNQTKELHIPYTRILTSVPLFALIVGYIPVICSYTMQTTQQPAYIKDVLGLDTHHSGYVSSLPFAASLLTMYIVSPIADYLIRRGILTATVVRKIYICGGLVLMAAISFLIQLATSVTAVVGCLVAMSMSSGAGVVQVMVNILDLAPKYSSVLSGLMTTAATVCGMFIPTAVGYLTQNKLPEEWHTVFSIQAGMCLLAALIYGVFGSGRLQYWAVDEDKGDAQEDRS